MFKLKKSLVHYFHSQAKPDPAVTPDSAAPPDPLVNPVNPDLPDPLAALDHEVNPDHLENVGNLANKELRDLQV